MHRRATVVTLRTSGDEHVLSTGRESEDSAVGSTQTLTVTGAMQFGTTQNNARCLVEKRNRQRVLAVSVKDVKNVGRAKNSDVHVRAIAPCWGIVEARGTAIALDGQRRRGVREPRFGCEVVVDGRC